MRRWSICGGACRTIVPDGARGSVIGISSYIANPVPPAMRLRRWLQPCTLPSCYLRHRCPNVHLCPVRRLLRYRTPLRPHHYIPTIHRPVLGQQKYHIPPTFKPDVILITLISTQPDVISQGPKRSSGTHVIRLHQSPQKTCLEQPSPHHLAKHQSTTRGRETHLTHLTHTLPGGDALLVQ